jgi:glutamate-1-semialdehyde 2,1-aminomutase
MIRSRRLLQAASQVIPGGVNSPVRAFRAVGGDPPFIARGERNRIYDVDGFEYVDLVSSWGAIIAGHAHPNVVEAVQAAAANGSSFGAPTEGEVELAQAICERVPSVQKVRLVSSGTEATMHALRLARAFTGRELIVKMDGCYHGAHDALLVNAGSGVATFGIPGSPGVPAAVAERTIVLPYNDLAAAEALFARAGDQIAAVIVEPIAGNMGCVLPVEGWLEGLRRLTEKHGALLIFDEVMTGFRVARGGAQERLHVTPDLTTLGKVIGGGYPLAAFGGRRDIMDMLSPIGPVYQGGTLSGNPVAVAAGLATLELLDPMAYVALEAAGARLEEALEPACAYHGCSIARAGAMFTVFFREAPPRNFAEAKTCDTEAFATWFNAALSGGVYLPCSQFEAAFYSFTLQGDDLEDAVDGLSAAFIAVEA